MTAESFEFAARREVIAELRPILQTGDILVRQSKTSGPLGMPFSTLVSSLTESRWSHSSIVYLKDGLPYVLEVTDRGVVELRLIDWLDYCFEQRFLVLRHADMTLAIAVKLRAEVDRYLEEDFEYDFSFNDMSRVYCVGSVCRIYEQVGLPLMTPLKPKEAIPSWWRYRLFTVLNALAVLLVGKGFDLEEALYFVGNEKKGVLACSKLQCVYERQG